MDIGIEQGLVATTATQRARARAGLHKTVPR